MNKDCNCHKGQGDVCPIHGPQDKPGKNLRQQIYDKIRTYRPNANHNETHANRITDEIMACIRYAVYDEYDREDICKHGFMSSME